MTQARLEEILSQEKITNEEMGEMLGDMFLSFSKHFKEIKSQMNHGRHHVKAIRAYTKG